MSSLPEFVGTVHIFFGPYRGNPIGLYLRKEGDSCSISPTVYPWNRFVGVGETANKAAADFDAKWKEGELAADMYSGPHWEGGIKPEKPKPPPKPAVPKPEAATPPEAAVAPKPDVGTAPASPATTGEPASPEPAPTSETTPPQAIPPGPNQPAP
ncbi:MAG: hypothetical protein OXF97_07225 [Nitrospira sp.]|nr:hypothetical protein [Nitrospira sp.]MCY4132641.1 hypothetical protein [Nitrospira sp.]